MEGCRHCTVHFKVIVGLSLGVHCLVLDDHVGDVRPDRE